MQFLKSQLYPSKKKLLKAVLLWWGSSKFYVYTGVILEVVMSVDKTIHHLEQTEIFG